MEQQHNDLLNELNDNPLFVTRYLSRKALVIITVLVFLLSVFDIGYILYDSRQRDKPVEGFFSTLMLLLKWSVINYIILVLMAILIASIVSRISFKNLNHRQKVYPFFLVFLSIMYAVEYFIYILF